MRKYYNLENELSKRNLRRKDLLEVFNTKRAALVSDKLNGKSEITYKEAVALRDFIDETLQVSYIMAYREV